MGNLSIIVKKNNTNITLIIKACVDSNRSGQKKLYELFYSYGISVALRYAKDTHEAKLIVNDAFMKVFLKIHQYDIHQSFQHWFRSIIVNCAIDHHRKYKKFDNMKEINDTHFSNNLDNNEGWDNLVFEDLTKQIQLLPPSYRVVFNLYAIEGYKHQEIAEKLNISIGSSKSNYFKAKAKLKVALQKYGYKKSVDYEG